MEVMLLSAMLGISDALATGLVFSKADGVDGSRPRHLSAKVGLLSGKPEQRSHPRWKLQRLASISPSMSSKFMP